MSEPGATCSYIYGDSKLGCAHTYLLPSVNQLLKQFFNSAGRNCGEFKIIDIGCGNGSVANYLTGQGFSVCGVDPSIDGINMANKAFPELRLEIGSAYDDLRSRFGTFPAVVSLEVIEHVYAPRDFMRTVHSLLHSGGIAVISTPYHGYLKNVAVSLCGRFDKHVNPLWDHGHIKFWSRRTLKALLLESGFDSIVFYRVGRIPPIAKSMIAVARKN